MGKDGLFSLLFLSEFRKRLRDDDAAAIFPAGRTGAMRNDGRAALRAGGRAGRRHLQFATGAILSLSRVSLLRQCHNNRKKTDKSKAGGLFTEPVRNPPSNHGTSGSRPSNGRGAVFRDGISNSLQKQSITIPPFWQATSATYDTGDFPGSLPSESGPYPFMKPSRIERIRFVIGPTFPSPI